MCQKAFGSFFGPLVTDELHLLPTRSTAEAAKVEPFFDGIASYQHPDRDTRRRDSRPVSARASHCVILVFPQLPAPGVIH